jgi:hypothetical protein
MLLVAVPPTLHSLYLPSLYVSLIQFLPSLFRFSGCPSESGWVKILDTKLKNEQGQTVQQVLVEILDKFPDYDLETKKGAEVAIRDIESKLVGMASFEEAEKKVANVAHNVGSS